MLVPPTTTVLPEIANFDASVPPRLYVPSNAGLCGFMTVEIVPTVRPAEPFPATNDWGASVIDEIVCDAGTVVTPFIVKVAGNGLFVATADVAVTITVYVLATVKTPSVAKLLPPVI